MIGIFFVVLVLAPGMFQPTPATAQKEEVKAKPASRSEQILEFLATKGHKRKLIVVFESYDACAPNNPVTLFGRVNGQGEFGTVSVARGEMKLIELPAVVVQLHWYCGGTRETIDNPFGIFRFDWVQLERAENGALHWTYLKAQ
jgi:hypothetical protein